ncbi:hypothetical protein [Croceibacterium ferulae]|uniref:hypothetical protein n=1 Tax=Croceibacterium ferulae TaxID=1854641 RepID=UPI000EB128A3|nr:hypothetical protein [Croceibacterium ferulae]
MNQWIEANWLLVVIALAIAALILLWIIAANRRTKVDLTRDESTADAPARRNQALIDAPPAAAPSPIPAPSLTPAPAPSPAPVAAPSAAAAPSAIAIEEPVRAVPDDMAGVEEAILVGASLTPPPAMVADSPLPAADGGESELLRIKGLGPKLVDQLRSLGITRLDQIAAWNDAEIDRIDAQLGRFQGRIRRDDWPTQARLLAADDIAGYEERFGRV